MKNAVKFILPMAALGMFVAGSTGLHAQDAQTTTTSSESTTTTTNGAPPPPPQEELAAPQPGYAEFGYQPDNYAAHRGYNEGYNKGLSDQTTGHSFRYKDDNSYRHPMGFHGGMNHDEYDRIYREAYVHGYERGYRRSATR